MKQIKIKLPAVNSFRLLRYLYPLTIFLVIIGLTALFLFLYQNVYQTLSQAEIVTMLKKEIPEQNLEKDKLLEVVQKIKTKSIPGQRVDQIKNPFIIKQATSTAEELPKK